MRSPLQLTLNCCKTGWKVCSVGSRFCNSAEANYSPTDGEFTGLVDALEKTAYFTLLNPVYWCTMCAASVLPASGMLYSFFFSVSTVMPVFLSRSGTLMFLITVSFLPSGWKLITPRSSASSSPSSGSGLVPPQHIST